MSFEKNLKALRLNRFLTQEMVATALHITKSTYSHYERGTRRPDVDMIYSMADFYGIRIEAFFSRPETKFTPNVNYCVTMNRLERELIDYFDKLSDVSKGKLIERAILLLEEDKRMLAYDTPD